VTEVAFHTGLGDKLAFACRLLRKAHRSGARVLVTGPQPLIERLDRELWTFDDQAFVPHLRRRPGEPETDKARLTPIWLCDGGGLPEGTLPPIVLNLGGDLPAEPTRFERVIEPVSNDEEDRREGRRRWRVYEALGLTIRHHAGGAA
jgi:DNA polymerase-3 subunit chi